MGMGEEERGKAVEPGRQTPQPSHRLLFLPLSLDLKTVWQNILLITFLIFKKKYSDKPSICPSPCLALPGDMADTGVEKLGAVCLLLFKQSHS